MAASVRAHPARQDAASASSSSSAVIRVSGVVEQSIVDGPGLRLTVFTQGCPHHCAGCHNPDTHAFSGGYDVGVGELTALLDANPLLSGLTLSGGEPLCRAEQLIPLAEHARARGKSVWCYTGYTFEEVLALAEQRSHVHALCRLVDVLVDGRYDASRRSHTHLFRGSANQRLIDMPRSLAAGKACLWRQESVRFRANPVPALSSGRPQRLAPEWSRVG